MKTQKRNRAFQLILFTLLALSVLFVFYFLFVRFKIGIPCVFNSITKLNCPGCGNTRAVVSLLHFHFREALRYNYLFPLEIFYIGWVYAVSAVSYIKNGRFSYTSPFRPFDISVLAALILWFIVRNIFHI